MNNNELYHYGVPGMRWGVRRAQKQLANLTGRDRTKVSAKEAERFRKDVKTFKKMNKAERAEIGNATLKTKYGKEYADAVIKQAGKEKVKSIIGKTATIAAGTAAVGLALKKLNQKMMDKHDDKTMNRLTNLAYKVVQDTNNRKMTVNDVFERMAYYSKFKNI